jgi:hypothetical protein
VLVTQGQGEALLRLVARMEREGVPAPSLARDPDAGGEIAPAAPLAIAPLDVRPLSVPIEPLERSDP